MLIGDDGLPQTGFMARNLPTPAALICEVLGINRLWPRNPFELALPLLGIDPMTTASVDQPAGAFLMFSRAAWETVGGFDERFWPVWFEDVDFCARIKAAGFRAYYHPKVLPSTRERTQFVRFHWRIGKDIGMVVYLSMLRNTIVLQHFKRPVELWLMGAAFRAASSISALPVSKLSQSTAV